MFTTNFFDRDILSDHQKFQNDIYLEQSKIADEIIRKEIQSVLDSPLFFDILKEIASKCGYKYINKRKITIWLDSGAKVIVLSPVFLKAKPKNRKRGKKKNREDVLKHFGLEYMGFIKRKSSGFVSRCTQAAILCPSFDVAVKFLNCWNININHGLLQRTVYSFASETMINRTTIALNERFNEKDLRLLICIDGGRIRERQKKRGRRNKGLKRQGFKAPWKEPKLFTISIIDKNGKVIRDELPLYDGTLGKADEVFELLEEYLKNFNLKDSQSVTFCNDGGPWMWNRIPELAKKLELKNYNEVLDYTHAKQNLRDLVDILLKHKGITKNNYEKTFLELKDYLWNGNINKIKDFVSVKMKKKRRGKNEAFKKLNNYFGDGSKFQYSSLKEKGLPIGSGTVESAIRRILNLRLKGPGVFWKKENAEKMIFLRSQLLSGRWNIMMKNLSNLRRNNLNSGVLSELENAA